MNADHQRSPARVAEPRALPIAAAVAASVPRQRDPVAAGDEQRPRASGDRERHRRLAGRTAAVLDLLLA